MAARVSLIATALALVASGCVGPQDAEKASRASEVPEMAPVVIPIDVHLVLVGVEDGLLEEDKILAFLPKERRPIVEAVTNSTGTPTLQPVLYRFAYTMHRAPDAFTQGFLDHALSTAEEGQANQWLVEYDAKGPKRLCDPCQNMRLEPTKAILYLDAVKTEVWVGEHRAEHGLDFGPGSLTMFLVDGEGAGVFPTDTYHSWRFDDGHAHSKVPKDSRPPPVAPPLGALSPIETPPFHTPKDTLTMRAWGGQFDFLWLDLTAAPTLYDYRPRFPVEPDIDPPLWDARNNPDAMHYSLARNLADFLQIRVARDPLYPTKTFDRFITPIHVFVDAGTMENPRNALGVDLEKWVPPQDILDSFRMLMPWVETEAPIMFHFLPQDDPGMAQALANAKRYSDPTLVSAGVIKAYVRENWAKYVPEEKPGEFVMPQFYFFFNGPYTFWGVSSAGGWADGDGWGRPWAIFDHFFDLCVRTNKVPCSKSTIGFNNLTLLPLHEAGHELGLTHTKDGADLHEDGWTRHVLNWLWDSTYSLMSYRHVYMRFDTWDQDFLAIAHTVGYLEQAHRGIAADPGSKDARGAREASDRARELVREGLYVEAVAEAKRAAELVEGQELTFQSLAPDLPEEKVFQGLLQIPASRTLVGSPLATVGAPQNPLRWEQAGATSASTSFDVPEEAKYFHVKYRDAAPQYAGTFKASGGIVYGPDRSFRGSLGESFEDEGYFTSHWRGAGAHEFRLFQISGTPGVYQVEIGVAR